MDIERLVHQVLQELAPHLPERQEGEIPIEVSARHCHLDMDDIMALFGEDLTPLRDLSQLGQYLSNQRVRIIGPKGVIDNVAVLGPNRKASQLELSVTDCRGLGITPVLRQSGDTKGSPGILVTNGDRFIRLDEGVIVAQNHIHMNPADATRLGVRDKALVSVATLTQRPLIFSDVLVRVDESFVLNMHIDYDEANACLAGRGSRGALVETLAKGVRP